MSLTESMWPGPAVGDIALRPRMSVPCTCYVQRSMCVHVYAYMRLVVGRTSCLFTSTGNSLVYKHEKQICTMRAPQAHVHEQSQFSSRTLASSSRTNRGAGSSLLDVCELAPECTDGVQTPRLNDSTCTYVRMHVCMTRRLSIPCACMDAYISRRAEPERRRLEQIQAGKHLHPLNKIHGLAAACCFSKRRASHQSAPRLNPHASSSRASCRLVTFLLPGAKDFEQPVLAWHEHRHRS
jgi:hypothetical protein